MRKTRYIYLLSLILFLFFIGFFILSIPYYSGDVNNHVIWGRSILKYGPQGFYSRQFHDYSFPNYPPISMASFAVSVISYDQTRSFILYLDNYNKFPSIFVSWIDSYNVLISFLKIPAILPFVLSGLVVFYLSRALSRTIKSSFLYTFLFLINPASIYLAVVWGQNDFTQVLFVLLAMLLYLKDYFYSSIISISLAILSKQTALMVWGLFLLNIFKTKGLQKSVIALIPAAILIWLFYLPFNDSNLLWPFIFYKESLRTTGLLIADNAINFWGVFSRFQPVSSQEVIFFLKLETWGFIFFGALFTPLAIKYLKSKYSNERLIYFFYIVSISYFFALSRMHERYLIFGVIFAHLLVVINKKYWPNLVFFSLVLFVNMYKGLGLPRWDPLLNLSNSTLFLIVLGVGYLLMLCFNYYYFMYRLKDEKN